MGTVNKRVPNRQATDRAMHTAFVRMTREMPHVPSYTFYDIRRGRRRVWGSLLRCIEEAVSAGAGMDDMLRIPEVLEAFITDCYDDLIARDRARRHA